MTDPEQFDHFKKKIFEKLFLHYRHFLPMGKPEPESYAELDFQLYKIYSSGVLEEMTAEPILEQEVKQLDIFNNIEPDKEADKEHNSPKGTMFDNLNEAADKPK